MLLRLDTSHACVCALAFASTLTLGCNRTSEEQPSKATPLVALEPGAAADALASVEFGPPEAHPELALRALAKLERERLGQSFAQGLEVLVEAPADKRLVALAPVIEQNMVMIDALCSGGGEALMGELSTIEKGREAELVEGRCGLEGVGLMDEGEAHQTDPAVLLMVHAAHAKLKGLGELEQSELELLKLALRFES